MPSLAKLTEEMDSKTKADKGNDKSAGSDEAERVIKHSVEDQSVTTVQASNISSGRKPHITLRMKPITKDGGPKEARDLEENGANASAAIKANPQPNTAMTMTENQMKEKERILMFTRVLMKYLEQRHQELHDQAKAAIKECYEKNKSGDPNFRSLATSTEAYLRSTVGEHHWKKAHYYLDHFLKQKREEKKKEGRIAGATLPPSVGAGAPGPQSCMPKFQAVAAVARNNASNATSTHVGPPIVGEKSSAQKQKNSASKGGKATGNVEGGSKAKKQNCPNPGKNLVTLANEEAGITKNKEFGGARTQLASLTIQHHPQAEDPDMPWCELWSQMKKAGWHSKPGDGLVTFYWSHPSTKGMKKRDMIRDCTEGVHYFDSEKKVQQYAMRHLGWIGSMTSGMKRSGLKPNDLQSSPKRHRASAGRTKDAEITQTTSASSPLKETHSSRRNENIKEKSVMKSLSTAPKDDHCDPIPSIPIVTKECRYKALPDREIYVRGKLLACQLVCHPSFRTNELSKSSENSFVSSMEHEIEKFMTKSILTGTAVKGMTIPSPGFMLICGGPGTGKTAAVTSCAENRKTWSKKNGYEKPYFCSINMASIRVLKSVKGGIMRAMLKKIASVIKIEKDSGLQTFEDQFKKKVVVLILDDIDMLFEKYKGVGEQWFRTLVAWAKDKEMRFSVIGISSSVNSVYTHRVREIGRSPNELIFPAYTEEDIFAILKQRLGKNIIDLGALHLISKIAASLNGDARKALEITSNAVGNVLDDLTEEKLRMVVWKYDDKELMPLVKLSHVMRASWMHADIIEQTKLASSPVTKSQSSPRGEKINKQSAKNDEDVGAKEGSDEMTENDGSSISKRKEDTSKNSSPKKVKKSNGVCTNNSENDMTTVLSQANTDQQDAESRKEASSTIKHYLTAPFNPDQLQSGDRVTVQSVNIPGLKLQATIRHLYNNGDGTPGFMVHIDGNSLESLVWVPKDKVISFLGPPTSQLKGAPRSFVEDPANYHEPPSNLPVSRKRKQRVAASETKMKVKTPEKSQGDGETKNVSTSLTVTSKDDGGSGNSCQLLSANKKDSKNGSEQIEHSNAGGGQMEGQMQQQKEACTDDETVAAAHHEQAKEDRDVNGPPTNYSSPIAIKQEYQEDTDDEMPPRLCWFRIVISGHNETKMIRLTCRQDFTFQDLRAKIEAVVNLPFQSFQFMDGEGEDLMVIEIKQEQEFGVFEADFHLTSKGDGCRRNPYHVYIQEAA